MDDTRQIMGTLPEAKKSYPVTEALLKNNQLNQKGKQERNFRMDMVTERELNIFRLIRDNYDRVIYILKKETGLYYSNQLAREILHQVYRSEIWMYPGISEYNFPWIILYMYGPQRLYKRLEV